MKLTNGKLLNEWCLVFLSSLCIFLLQRKFLAKIISHTINLFNFRIIRNGIIESSMMKYLFLLLCLCCIQVYGQKHDCNAKAFLSINYKGKIPLYASLSCDTVLTYLENDYENENILHFHIKKQCDKMLYVHVSDLYNQLNADWWLFLGDYVCVYSRAYQGSLKLYNAPCESSGINSVVEGYDLGMYIVVGCSGDWLKVKRIKGDKIYTGWLSPEMQCDNPYSTCS